MYVYFYSNPDRFNTSDLDSIDPELKGGRSGFGILFI